MGTKLLVTALVGLAPLGASAPAWQAASSPVHVLGIDLESRAGLEPALLRDDAEDAARELEKAEALASKGRYSAAVRAYERIAKDYPKTAAGLIAERRTEPNALLGWNDLMRNGPSANRVDIVLMADGILLDKQKSFDKLAADFERILERNRTIEEYLSYFNVIRANVRSAEDGLDEFGREKDTALGAAIQKGALQNQVTVDRTTVHAYLDMLPEHDGLAIVVVPRGSLGTGGNGVAAVGGRNFDSALHEFGHAFCSLKDEYSQNTGFRGDPSSQINVSATEDPKEVPWAHWIEAKVPGVGVYQGADGRVRGAWKPTSKGCIMGEGEIFCVVCREALLLRIYEEVDPIERETPVSQGPSAGVLTGEEHLFEVTVMRPAKHALEVRWWVLPADQAPQPTLTLAGTGARGARGPLPPIKTKPLRVSRNNRSGEHELRVKASSLEPGRYRVICRVKDTTRHRGERWPWVLKDEKGVLESERGWWIEVE